MGALRRTQFAVLLSISSSIAAADEIMLKCRTATGQEAVDLRIDLASNRMDWGGTAYTITKVTDNYLTAIQNPEHTRVGGEVWVLDRVTGAYKRASVYMRCSDESCISSELSIGSYEGTCREQMF